MNDMSNTDNVSYKIRKIKQVSFYINENLFSKNNPQPLTIELNQNFGFSVENNLIVLSILVFYKLPDSNESQPPLVQIEVQNIFEIADLEKFFVDQSYIKLPPKIITSVVGLSISHTRALLSTNILGTVFQDQLLSIMDAETVAKHFYPYMFDNSIPADIIETIR